MDIGKAPVEFELYRLFGYVERELAESAVVVFPTAVLLFKAVIAEALDGFGERRFRDRDPAIAPTGLLEHHPLLGNRR